jgi:membrane-associated phospholipid phosphatase
MLLTLPIINQNNKGRSIIIGYFLFCLFYLSAGYIHLITPKILIQNVIDQHIPFMAWTIWIYLSQFFILFLALWIDYDDVQRTITYYAFLLAIFIAFVFFLIFPVEMPRHLINSTGITAFLWHSLYFNDVATNCFPSLHSADAALAANALIKTKNWRWLFPAWAAAICISTLTTKQHYCIDVVAGLLLAIGSYTISYYLFRRTVSYEKFNCQNHSYS